MIIIFLIMCMHSRSLFYKSLKNLRVLKFNLPIFFLPQTLLIFVRKFLNEFYLNKILFSLLFRSFSNPAIVSAKPSWLLKKERNRFKATRLEFYSILKSHNSIYKSKKVVLGKYSTFELLNRHFLKVRWFQRKFRLLATKPAGYFSFWFSCIYGRKYSRRKISKRIVSPLSPKVIFSIFKSVPYSFVYPKINLRPGLPKVNKYGYFKKIFIKKKRVKKLNYSYFWRKFFIYSKYNPLLIPRFFWKGFFMVSRQAVAQKVDLYFFLKFQKLLRSKKSLNSITRLVKKNDFFFQNVSSLLFKKFLLNFKPGIFGSWSDITLKFFANDLFRSATFYIWWFGKMVVFRPNPLLNSLNSSLAGLKKFRLIDALFFKRLLFSFRRRFLLKFYKRAIVRHHTRFYFKKRRFKKLYIRGDFLKDSRHRNILLSGDRFRERFLSSKKLKLKFFGKDFFNDKLFGGRLRRKQLFSNFSFRTKFFNYISFRRKFLRNKKFREKLLKCAFLPGNLANQQLFFGQWESSAPWKKNVHEKSNYNSSRPPHKLFSKDKRKGKVSSSKDNVSLHKHSRKVNMAHSKDNQFKNKFRSNHNQKVNNLSAINIRLHNKLSVKSRRRRNIWKIRLSMSNFKREFLKKVGSKDFKRQNFFNKLSSKAALLKLRYKINKKKFYRNRLRREHFPRKWLGVVASNKFLNILKLITAKKFRKKSLCIYDSFLLSKYKTASMKKFALFSRLKTLINSKIISKNLNFLNKFHYFTFLRLMFFWFIVFYDILFVLFFKFRFLLWLNFLAFCFIPFNAYSFFFNSYDLSFKRYYKSPDFFNQVSIPADFFFSKVFFLSKIYVSFIKPFYYKTQSFWFIKELRYKHKPPLKKLSVDLKFK